MNLETMSLEELEKEMKSAYGSYMYEEAAERGYDYKASRAAFNRYIAAKMEIEKRQSNMATD